MTNRCRCISIIIIIIITTTTSSSKLFPSKNRISINPTPITSEIAANTDFKALIQTLKTSKHDKKIPKPPIKTNNAITKPHSNILINQQFTTTISSLSNKAEGLAYIPDLTTTPFSIPHTLPGEDVTFKVTKISPTTIDCELISINKNSTDRVVPMCSISSECGGCQLQHSNYTAQLKYKHNNIQTSLYKYKPLQSVVINEVLPSLSTSHYRNKAQFAIQRDTINRYPHQPNSIRIGLYKKQSHDVCYTIYCDIQHTFVNIILNILNRFFGLWPDAVPVYDETTGLGALRHVVIRVGFESNEIMVCFVSAKPLSTIQLALQPLVTQLSELTQVKSILYHHNSDPSDNVLSYTGTTADTILYGTDVIHDTIATLKVKISLYSFTQSNPIQAYTLYTTVLQLAELIGDECIYDLYSGIGMIGLFLSRHVHRVIGIEDIPSAVDDARYNQQLNHITNTEFICDKAEGRLPTLPHIPNEVAIVNPPRKGCHPSLLKEISARGIKKVIYVSCNPDTLSRDLAVLVGYGYKVGKVQPVDMFPQTVHVETVVVLEK